MKVMHISPKSLTKIKNLTLCLGYFDAFHLGHISLINKAKEIGGTIGVLTMNPNPASLFNKEVKNVYSLEERIEIVSNYNIDYFIILDTNFDVLNMSKESFIDEILIPLGVKNIVCGFDYSFGKGKSGNTETLINNKMFNTYVVEPILDQNEKISTSLIKELLKKGEVERINKLLNRYYYIKGKVMYGKHLGTTIGFPTINISLENDKVYPKEGVYAGYVIVDNNEYLSMMNIGKHPTVNELNKPNLEVHIINENLDLYNKEVKVIFKKRIRDEMKFSSINELINQLELDKKEILNLLNKLNDSIEIK